jgi:hypothetical protein
MATCAECGSANPDGSRFCGSCGKPLPTAEAAAPEEDVSSAPTTEQPATGYTPQHAAYNEALAAINAPSSAGGPTTEEPAATTEQPAAAPTAQQPPVTTVPPVSPPPTPTTAAQPPVTSTMPPTVTSSGGGSNKKVLALVGGGVALLLILGAVWFFFIRDDSEPVSNPVELTDESLEDDSTEEEVTDDASVDPGSDPVDPAAFDSIAPLIAQSAGPYSITQESAEPCTPPCIFPPEAHDSSLETYQATWDAGTPESEIFGEFMLYPSETEAAAGVAQTVGFLESSGYEAVDTFDIQGVPGTVYQSPDSEILLYQESNLMMGLFGNKGFPIEFVGYLNQ